MLPVTVLSVLAFTSEYASGLIRTTFTAVPGAAVTVIYLLTVMCLVLPSPWNLRLGRFTLPFAAYQLVTLHPQPGLLSPSLSMLVLIGWPAATLLAAAVMITRRDA